MKHYRRESCLSRIKVYPLSAYSFENLDKSAPKIIWARAIQESKLEHSISLLLEAWKSEKRKAPVQRPTDSGPHDVGHTDVATGCSVFSLSSLLRDKGNTKNDSDWMLTYRKEERGSPIGAGGL